MKSWICPGGPFIQKQESIFASEMSLTVARMWLCCHVTASVISRKWCVCLGHFFLVTFAQRPVLSPPATRHSSPLLPLMIKCLEQCSYRNSLVGHKLNSWNPLITFTNSCYGICILYSTSKANTFYVLRVQAVTGNSWRPQQPVSAVTMHASFMELCIALVKFIYIGLHRASSGQTGVRIVRACIAIFPPGCARDETESWRQGLIAGYNAETILWYPCYVSQ